MRLAYYDESVIERMSVRSGISVETGIPTRVVGVCTGFVAVGLALRVERVIGVDNSPAMLRTARGNLDTLGAENVELVRGVLSALPLNSGSVDAAFANMVLHHAEDPAAMTSEMARVVRPGGSVVTTDEVAHPYEWMRREHADVWLGFSEEEVAGFFERAGLVGYGYESLGMQ